MNIIPQVKERNVTQNYAAMQYDNKGWVETNTFRPVDFDLCYLKNTDGKIKVGWRSGNHWDGLKIVYAEEFTHWKRNKNL